jgi:hypothetical protein
MGKRQKAMGKREMGYRQPDGYREAIQNHFTIYKNDYEKKEKIKRQI